MACYAALRDVSDYISDTKDAFETSLLRFPTRKQPKQLSSSTKQQAFMAAEVFCLLVLGSASVSTVTTVGANFLLL